MKVPVKELKEDIIDEEKAIEEALKRLNNVCKHYYLTFPKGESWHKELIDLSVNPPKEKMAIFNQSIVERLHPYRSFRHRFVSGYGFQLSGEKMLGLIDNIDLLWSDIQKAISEFIGKLS